MSTSNDPTNSSQDVFLDKHDMLKAGLTDPAVVALGISAADIAAINSDNTLLHTKKSASDIADGVAQQATKDKDNAFKLGKANYRAIRQRIMKNAGYTPAIGELLGVELPETQPAPGPGAGGGQPVLRGTPLVSGGAEIKSTKGGAEAVDIYSKRDNDADFAFLKRVMHFPYIDNRPLLVAGKPEKREYYGVFVRHDQQYGDASAIITVIVSA